MGEVAMRDWVGVCRDPSPIRQKLSPELVKLVHGVPLNQMFAVVDNVEIKLRIFFLEQRSSFKSIGAVVLAEHQQQRAGELD